MKFAPSTAILALASVGLAAAAASAAPLSDNSGAVAARVAARQADGSRKQLELVGVDRSEPAAQIQIVDFNEEKKQHRRPYHSHEDSDDDVSDDESEDERDHIRASHGRHHRENSDDDEGERHMRPHHHNHNDEDEFEGRRHHRFELKDGEEQRRPHHRHHRGPPPLMIRIKHFFGFFGPPRHHGKGKGLEGFHGRPWHFDDAVEEGGERRFRKGPCKNKAKGGEQREELPVVDMSAFNHTLPNGTHPYPPPGKKPHHGHHHHHHGPHHPHGPPPHLHGFQPLIFAFGLFQLFLGGAVLHWVAARVLSLVRARKETRGAIVLGEDDELSEKEVLLARDSLPAFRDEVTPLAAVVVVEEK